MTLEALLISYKKRYTVCWFTLLPGITNISDSSQREGKSHVQFSWERAGLTGIWVLWNSGEVLPDRIK